MRLSAAVLVFLGGLSGPADGGGSCAEIERDLWQELSQLFLVMEPEGSRRSISDRAAEAGAGRCRDSETLAYIRVRVTELGTQAPLARAGDRQAHVQLARALALAFPRSARIATVRARAGGTVEDARRAVGLDPSYRPAQVALASALLNAGDAAAADSVMRGVSGLGGLKALASLEDGFSILARIRWARGDVAGAIDAANRQLTGRDLLGVEPGTGDRDAIVAAHEVLALAYLKRGQPLRAAPHLIEAEPGSPRVQEIIQQAGPELQQAIARARRGAK